MPVKHEKIENKELFKLTLTEFCILIKGMGLPKYEVSVKLGRSESYISKCLQGNSTINPNYIRILHQEYGADLVEQGYKKVLDIQTERRKDRKARKREFEEEKRAELKKLKQQHAAKENT